MADGQRQRKGDVGRAVDSGEPEHLGDHALHLFLGGGPVADESLLDLVRGVLDDLAPRRRRNAGGGAVAWPTDMAVPA